MPLRKSGTILTAPALLLAAGLALPTGASAATTSTSASCVQPPTTKAFAAVGDGADYALAPGGDFETSAGWTLTDGAKIATGNETLGVSGGSRSLSLPIGATATSPPFCVDETNPSFRFVAKPDNAVAGYQAIVIYRDSAGFTRQAQFTSSSAQSWGAGTWTASAISPLATKIPLLSGDTASVQLRFVSTGNTVAFGVGAWGKLTGGSIGTVSVDSVMVDPYRRG